MGMYMNRIIAGIVLAAGTLAVAETAVSVYFYRRTMKRSKAKKERTIKMAGTDWDQYMDVIHQKKEQMMSQEHEDIYQHSKDDLKLHATYFPGNRGKKMVICFHGYTSQGTSDYIGLSSYYMSHGYQMLLVDERAHGESEGEYIGFGYRDRIDAMGWIDWVIKTNGEDIELLLHGMSMGGATVLMASGLALPKQVKGIISDCGFTSPKYVFTHVLHTMYHMPAFPMMQITDFLNRTFSGFGLDQCNSAREVRKAKVPILLIHGDADHFVPCSMCHEIYDNCASPKMKLIVKGAAHAESYYKDTAAYEKALDDFIGGVIL